MAEKQEYVITNIRVPKEVHERAKRYALKVGLNVSSLFCVAVQDYIKQGTLPEMVEAFQSLEKRFNTPSAELVEQVRKAISKPNE